MTTDRRETTISREGEGITAPTHIPTASSVDAAPQHSPLPWRAVPEDEEGGGLPDLLDATGEPIIDQWHAPMLADAAFIVRAVNSHDDLLAALKAIVAFWNESGIGRCDEDDCDCIDHLAHAAIAKAEGRLS